MEERIRERIATLEEAERDATARLTIIMNLLSELRGLLAGAHDGPILSGDPLDEREETTHGN